MKPFILLLSAALALPASAAAYECTDRNGRKTYTSTPQPNCRRAELGRISIYTPPPAASAPQHSASAPPYSFPTTETKETAAVPLAAEIQAAEQRLVQARKQLEEGRQVRYGSERNYARYLERIKGLENAVSEAERQLEEAKSGSGKP